jgi:hypothetical protein
MPTNYYLEVQVRVSADPIGPHSTFDSISVGGYLYDVNAIDPNFTPYENDPTNLEGPGDYQVGDLVNWGNGLDSPHTAISDCTSQGSCVSSLNFSSLHTYAVMTRSNGTSGNTCAYLDNAPVTAGGNTNNCLNSQLTSNQANNYRGIFVPGGGNQAQNFTIYWYHFRVWTRAGCAWQSNPCLGDITIRSPSS